MPKVTRLLYTSVYYEYTVKIYVAKPRRGKMNKHAGYLVNPAPTKT